jgi:hypothetical protein
LSKSQRNKDLLRRLTRAGLLQCPTVYLTVEPERISEYRDKWYETFKGQCAILAAEFKEMIFNLAQGVCKRMMK